MTIQRSVAARDAANNGFSTTLGVASVTLLLFTGPPPVDCAAADTGTLVITLALPNPPLAASSGGTISKTAADWTGTVSASGTNVVGHYRLKNSAAAVVEQGTIAQPLTVNTSALTAANSNILTFASAPAVVAGQTISGTGVPARTNVVAVVGSTVVMSRTSTTGVASGASITFGGDMNLNNPSLANGQTVTVTTYSQTEGNA